MFKYIMTFMLIGCFIVCGCDNPFSSKKETVIVEKETITMSGLFTLDDLYERDGVSVWAFEFIDDVKTLYNFDITVLVRENSNYSAKEPIWSHDRYWLWIAIGEETQVGYEYIIEIVEK